MKRHVLLLLIIIFGSCVFAADFSIYKTNSGQTIIVKQVKSNPIVIIDTWVKTGSINENDKNNGVSHFLEHLFFKGTENNPAGTFDNILESKGAITNAATSKDFTHYYIKIPSKDFDLALNLHADMLLNPQIPRNEMEKERKVVLEEIAKDKNSPNDIVYDNLNELIFKVHPYKREVIGKSKIIETITREEILDYYNKNYSPENMVTIVIGDINPEETIEKIKIAFNTPPRKLEKHKYKKEPKITAQRVKEVKFDSNSGYMMIGFKGTNAKHKDMYALDVLASILGDGRSSRFYQHIKDQKQLANSISAANGSFKDDGVFYVSTNFQAENKDKLKSAIFEELKNLKTQGITNEELERAKNIITRDTHYSRESISNIASEMGYTLVLTNDIKNYENYLLKINSVTAKDVKKVANKYLNENKCAISIVTPNKTTKNIEKITQKHSAKLVKSAYNTDKFILDTGSTLLLNRHKNNDIIAISIKAKGGEFLEQIAGTGDLTASTMIKSTKNYSQIELSQILEENGIEITPSSNADYFSINVLTTKEQLPLTLKLLNEIVNNAKFDEFEIEKAKKNILNGIKSARDIPLNKALEEYKTELFAGSVYSHTSKILEKTIPNIKRQNIVNFYKTIFYPKNLVISVNGDVEKDYIVNELANIFNHKNNGTDFVYAKHANNIPAITTPKTITTQIKDLQTSWIILGWQTSGTNEIKEFATLQVIDAFMGTGMSSRLFRNIRENLGLAYQIGTGFSPNVLKGGFTMYIGTNPKNIQLAKTSLLKEIQTLKKEFVGDKELQDAKNQLIGKYLLALETNLDKANALALYEATGRGFDFVDNYAKIINSITPSDIMEVANKYFLDNYVESVVDKAK